MKRRLYLDYDGVLADFDAHFVKLFGITPTLYEAKYGPAAFWSVIKKADKFYENLPLMPGAGEFFEAVKHNRPLILTGCPQGSWAEVQKIRHAARHFKGTPCIVTLSRNKKDYCQPGDILVDDTAKYADLWNEAGGIFIHHTSVQQTLSALKAIDPVLVKEPEPQGLFAI